MKLRLEAQTGELVTSEKVRVRRATMKDIPSVAEICAQAFTDAALQKYPACKRATLSLGYTIRLMLFCHHNRCLGLRDLRSQPCCLYTVDIHRASIDWSKLFA